MQDIHKAGLHFLVDDASGAVWVHIRGRWLYQPHLRPCDARRRGALYVARSEEPGTERAAGTRGDWDRDVRGRVVCTSLARVAATSKARGYPVVVRQGDVLECRATRGGLVGLVWDGLALRGGA